MLLQQCLPDCGIVGTITLGLLWWWCCRAADISNASLWIGSFLRSLRHALLGFRCRFVVFGLSSATHKAPKMLLWMHELIESRINNSTIVPAMKRRSIFQILCYFLNLIPITLGLLYLSGHWYIHCSKSNSSYVPWIRLLSIQVIRDNS